MIKHLLIVGGVGHSTTYLYDNIARHPVYKDCLEIGVSEAELYAKVLMTNSVAVMPLFLNVGMSRESDGIITHLLCL